MKYKHSLLSKFFFFYLFTERDTDCDTTCGRTLKCSKAAEDGLYMETKE